MTVSAENATSLKPTKSRSSDSSVSRGTNSNWDFVLIWICIEEFVFLDLVDFRGVAFPVESHAHLIFYTELRWLDDEIYILYRNNTYTHARFIFHTERKRLYRIFFISYKNNTYAHAYFMFYTEIKWLCRKTNILYRKKLYTHAHFMFNTEMKWLCTKTYILYREKLYTQITLYFIQK